MEAVGPVAPPEKLWGWDPRLLLLPRPGAFALTVSVG